MKSIGERDGIANWGPPEHKLGGPYLVPSCSVRFQPVAEGGCVRSRAVNLRPPSFNPLLNPCPIDSQGRLTVERKARLWKWTPNIPADDV